ncbi:MAG: serine hydrolase [archaeon]
MLKYITIQKLNINTTMLWLLLCIVSLLCAPLIIADSSVNLIKPSVSENIDKLVLDYTVDCTGSTVGIAYNSKIVYTKSFGSDSVSSVHDWASVSKPLTALIAMRLNEKGIIESIDDNIWKYAKQIKGTTINPDSPPMPTTCDDGQSCASSSLTIKQLMIHNGGFYHLDEPLWENGKLNLKYKPGTSHSYSSDGVCVEGDVISGASGMTYPQAVQEYIVKNMVKAGEACSLYAKNDWWAPAAYIRSNIHDFSLYTIGIINNAFVSSNTLYNKMLVNYYGGYMGLGFQIENSGDNIAAFHSGNNGVPKAYMYIKPKLKRSVVLFCQAKSGSSDISLSSLARKIDSVLAQGNPCQNPADCQESIKNITLTVLKKGNGLGTVLSNINPKINCGALCVQNYPANTVITLNATTNSGSAFTGWSGSGCSGNKTCVITLTSNTIITAVFNLSDIGCSDNDNDNYTTCGGDCNDNNANIFPGASETCNNLDDNCDNQKDEGLTKQQSCGTGACQRTVSQSCSSGQYTPACVSGTATTEICGNGIDENCDGHDDTCQSENITIIDDNDPGFSTSYSQDTWLPYIQEGGLHYGNSHYFNEQIGTGMDKATWTFTVPKSGYYDVFAWWYEYSYRPSDVPFTINTYYGPREVKADQRINGGKWNLLGNFYFYDKGNIFISDNATNGKDIVADAIKLVLTSESQPVTKTGDLNIDGLVNNDDLQIVVNNYGRQSGFDARADANEDNKIDLLDLIFVTKNYYS